MCSFAFFIRINSNSEEKKKKEEKEKLMKKRGGKKMDLNFTKFQINLSSNN
jgi:asparagine synthetase B (glutamine-hydrolysing)